MCIIAIKPSGTKFPSDETITTMWSNNPDGAGFMYTKRSEVIIEKGFMKLAQFLGAVHDVCKEVDPTDTPFILHFRITTHGGTCPECTHPFPITNNMAMLRKSHVITDMGVAHNGIISAVTPRDKHTSDTQEYIATILSPMKRSNKKFFQSKALMELIANTAGSKLAFLTGDGHVYTVGEFVNEPDGMSYSNSSYKPRLWTYNYPIGSYYGGSWNYSKTATTSRAGSVVRYLMQISDAPSHKSSMSYHLDNGVEISAFTHAVDNKGRLYRYDKSTGAYYKVNYKPVEKLPAWSVHYADSYETYESLQALQDATQFDDPWDDYDYCR